MNCACGYAGSTAVGGSIDAVPFTRRRLPRFEVDEQHADVRIHARVAERQEHAVAVVVREHERGFVQHAHEARIAALVRTVRPAFVVRGREEEHVAALDELAILRRDARVVRDLFEAIREPFGIELPLQLAMTFFVET